MSKVNEAKCICLNDKGRPNEVPSTNWVVKGKEYTIIHVAIMVTQNNIIGVKLKEINNDAYFPYTFFNIDRFGIPLDELIKFEKLFAPEDIEKMKEILERDHVVKTEEELEEALI